jgi:Tol biopolymer transport system component
MDLNGGALQQLSKGKGDSWPTLSPDGRWVVYTSWVNGQPALWKAPVDGAGEPIQLSQKALTLGVISPDGRWIACSAVDEKDRLSKIAVLPFEGGEPRMLDRIASPDYNLLDWTPDSRAVVYSSTQKGVSNLMAQPLDNGPPKQLTHFTSDRIFRFAWSRDGKSLACERGVSIEDAILFTNAPPRSK